MNLANEEQNVPILIDLTGQTGVINESFLRMFGASIELILKRMFGLNNLNFQVRGRKSHLRQFADTLNREAAVMKAFQESGLANPSTTRSKVSLARAVAKFESQTGIRWPLK